MAQEEVDFCVFVYRFYCVLFFVLFTVFNGVFCGFVFLQRDHRCLQRGRELLFQQEALFFNTTGPLQTALTFLIFGVRSLDFYTVRIISS